MRLSVTQFELRETPAVVTAAPGSVLSGFPGPVSLFTNGVFSGAAAGEGGAPVVEVRDAAGNLVSRFFAFDESFRGGVGAAIDDRGIWVSPLPYSGGGPVLRNFDVHGNLLSSVYVGDENSRDGLYIAAGETGVAAAPPVNGVPLDLSRLGVRFVGGTDPTADQWQRLRASLALLPPAAFRLLIAGGSSIDVVNGVSITTRPGLAPGTQGLYGPIDGLSGVADPIVLRLDEQPNGSADVVLHEVWHEIDKLLDYPSRGAPWLFRHATTVWPTAYETTYPAEAFAESGARFSRGAPQPDDRIDPFFAILVAQLG